MTALRGVSAREEKFDKENGEDMSFWRFDTCKGHMKYELWVFFYEETLVSMYQGLNVRFHLRPGLFNTHNWWGYCKLYFNWVIVKLGLKTV